MANIPIQKVPDEPSINTAAALARIRSRPRVNPLKLGLPDSTELIREDRER